MYAFLADDTRYWHTMTSGDIAIAMDFANSFSAHRDDIWLNAFEAKAQQLGYKPVHRLPACDCGRFHHAGCGLAKPRDLSRVWPHDDEVHGILNVDRLPSAPNPFAVEPLEHITPHVREPLPPIPDDAEYTGCVPESDADSPELPLRSDAA